MNYRCLNAVRVLIFTSLIVIFAVTPDRAAGWQLASLPGLLEDAARLGGKSNRERQSILQDILTEKGIEYSIEPFSAKSERNNRVINGNNIVVTLGSGESDFVIGAHYDRVDVGSGLVDNGCSAIILTRIIEALSNEELNHRIRIVFFDQEEVGLVGSAQFIEQHKGDPIESMINLDVNAYGNTTLIGPSASTGINRLYRLAKTICVENDFEFLVFPEYGASDDISFQHAGIESISLGISTAEQAYQFWLALNGSEEFQPAGTPKVFTMIHSKNDALKEVESAAMAQNYTIVLEMIKRLDKMD